MAVTDQQLTTETVVNMSTNTPQPTKAQWNSLAIIYAVSTAWLFFKYFLSAVYAVNADNHPEEDSIIYVPPIPSNIRRRERQFANDMENIPLHMAIFWAAFIVQNFANASGNGGRDGTIALSCLIVIYTFVRTLFTLFYCYGIQPFRTLCFVLGTCSVITTLAILIYSAVQLDMTKVFPFAGVA